MDTRLEIAIDVAAVAFLRAIKADATDADLDDAVKTMYAALEICSQGGDSVNFKITDFDSVASAIAASAGARFVGSNRQRFEKIADEVLTDAILNLWSRKNGNVQKEDRRNGDRG
jgi:hypothetical protein